MKNNIIILLLSTVLLTGCGTSLEESDYGERL